MSVRMQSIFSVIFSGLFATWAGEGPRDELDKPIEH